MKKISLLSMALIFAFFVNAQVLTQTIRGTIVDADSKLPIIGATVRIVGGNPVIGTSTNVSGQYQLNKVPIGNITLQISYVGYEGKTIPEIELNAGKETILNISLQEQVVKMNEAVVVAYRIDKGNARNEMNMISSRSVSPEESKRYAGSFNDPAKILSNFAGVASSPNGENDIIVRGNSPKYMQWRLEGVEITNPTHFADQNGVKGGISALNNNLLAPSDFSTGAFSAEYGDVLSGVLDVKLRAGNTQKFEAALGVGIIGTDITLEGPLKKGYGGSYLINYRYSTVSLINDLGLVAVPGALKFQDAAFKLLFPTKKAGVFSMFGLGGLSGFKLENVGPDEFSTPTNKVVSGRLSEDYDKDAFLANYGLTHTINLNQKSYLSTTVAYSNNGILEDIYSTITTQVKDQQGNVLYDSAGTRQLNYKNRLSRSVYRGALTYNNKLNAKNTIQSGTKYALFVFDMNTSQLNNTNQRVQLVDRNEQIANLRNFINWKHRFNPFITMVAGFHNMNVLYNAKSTIEPRIAFQAKLNSSNSVNIGYGKHSAMESVHNYFTKVTDANGNTTEPNKDLDLLKADHVVLGYEKRLSKNMRLKTEVYYQYLYNLPVENNDTSYYATLNEASDFRYVDLVNKGTGQNYGIEITLERFFADNYYFLINGSLYNSTYKSLEGVERNTMYNGNYLVNILAGKDYVGLGKKKNQVLTLNAKLFFAGGQRQILLSRDANGNLDVDPSANRFWDYKNAYRNKIDDVYEITISVNYKWNKPKATHELFLNLQNLTGVQARISEIYDSKKPNGVDHVKQFGFFPNLMYRLYF
ncbi:MAG: carboxypeptidase-like regulatory domain-containing protein [Bacteroidota bacterium]